MLIFGFIILGLAYLLPGHYPPWTSFEQQFAAAVGVAIVIIGALVARRTSAPIPRASVFVLGLACVPVIQWAGGLILFRSDAVLSAVYLVGLALSLAAGQALASERASRWLDLLGVALIGAAAVSTLLAVCQWFGWSADVLIVSLPRGERPYANLAQPNHLATLCAMALAFSLRAWERRQLRSGAAAGIAAWLSIGMILTQSRTNWLFVAMFVVWWYFMRKRCGLRLNTRAVMAGIAAYVLLTIAWQLVSLAFVDHAPTLGQRGGGAMRVANWSVLWDALWRHPWAGYGWSQVTLAQQAAALDHPHVGEWLTNSHSILLDLVLWNGVPLGLILIACLAGWFAARIRECRSPQAWSILLALAAIAVHALLEYPLDYTYFLLPAGLLAGALIPTAAAVPARLADASVRALTVAAAILLAAIGAEYLTMQHAIREYRFAAAQFVGADFRSSDVPHVILLDGLREQLRFSMTEARGGMRAEELDWMRVVSTRYATPPAMLRYAIAAGLNGQSQEARTTLARLCKVHPLPRCEEAAQAWRELQGRHSELRAIEPWPVSAAAH